MADLKAYCTGCRKIGHWLFECPENVIPIKIKKPWIKPKLTRWVKAEVFTACSQVVHKEESVNRPVHKDRKEYRREWMRKKREANRVG